MDELTLENLKTMGVEVPNNNPTPVPVPTIEEIKQVVEEAKKSEDPANTPAEPPQDINPEPEIKQPDAPTEPIKEPEVVVKEETIDAENLDDVLKQLEDLSKESSADIQDPNKKIKKLVVPENEQLTKKDNKTIQEIVDLNVKLQNELSVSRISETAKDRKIQELSEKISSYELDDTKEEVLPEIKWINKYMKQFKSSNNETFKVKATQEALDFIEQTRWVPLKWDYLWDRIEEQLKVVERMTQKSSDDIERNEPKQLDPNEEYIRAHWIGL